MSSSSSIVATKILVVSSSVVLVGMTMKTTIIPWLISFSVSEVPIIWSVLVSLCKPPYLYVVINAIIITIAASSRFTAPTTETEMECSSSSEHFPHPIISAKTPPLIEVQHGMFEAAAPHDSKGLNVKNQVVKIVEVAAEEEVENERMEAVEAAFNMPPQQPEVVLPVRGKPRALSRFGPPKPSQPTPQGKREVIIEAEEVTLESMWKTIMEGREEPLEQSMKKSDMIIEEDYTQKKVGDESGWKTTASYKGGASYLSEAPLKSWILKKEPTLGQDELNRRADEFIQKFNQEMRMQRQQSLQQNINSLK